MRWPLLLLALLVAACDSAPLGEPDATYPYAGDHPLIGLDEVSDVRPTPDAPDLLRNVEVYVAGVSPCSQAEREAGACVTDTITLVEDLSDPAGFELPADTPTQFEVGARYRITPYFFAGDDSVAVYLRGYTRI